MQNFDVFLDIDRNKFWKEMLFQIGQETLKRFVTFIFALSICFILIDMSQQNFKKGRKIRINLENLKVIFKSYDEEYDKVFLRKNYLIFFFLENIIH